MRRIVPRADRPVLAPVGTPLSTLAPTGTFPDVTARVPEQSRPTRPTGRPTSCSATGARRTCGRSGPTTRSCWSASTSRVSDESKYLRFFAPMPRLSERDIARFSTVDHHDRVAFVLTVAGRMIAVGRYDVVAPGRGRGRVPGRGRPPGPRHRPAAARAPRAGRPRARRRPVRGRRAARERQDDPGLPRRRLPGRGWLRRGRDAPGVPDRPHRHRHRRDAGPRAPGRGGLDRGVLRRPQRRGDRSLPAPGHDRPGAGAPPRARRLLGPDLRRQPDGRLGGRACRRTRRSRRSPATSTSRSSRCRPTR